MTSTLQNRLVGTIIVVALVVIVVPEFLDGEKRINKQDFVNVPPVAELVEVPESEPFDTSEVEQQVHQSVEIVDEIAVDAEPDEENNKQAPETINDSQSAAQIDIEQNDDDSNNSSTQTSAINSNENSLDEIDIRDSGWVVQLGSFKHEKNVRELLNTLSVAGYRAYSRPVMTSVGELNKVFVGPELDRKTLELALPHLTELTKLKGKITAFEVSAN